MKFQFGTGVFRDPCHVLVILLKFVLMIRLTVVYYTMLRLCLCF